MHITSAPAHQRKRTQPMASARITRHEQSLDPTPDGFGSISLGAVYPEAALMCAVLEDAFRCFRKRSELDRKGASAAKEAQNWFFSDDSRELFSFVSICALLELEPEFIRRGLKHWTDAVWTPRRKRYRIG